MQHLHSSKVLKHIKTITFHQNFCQESSVIIELFDIQPCGTSTLLVGKCLSNKNASCRHHNGAHPQSHHKSRKSEGLRNAESSRCGRPICSKKCQGTGNASIGVGTPQCIVPIRALLWPIWGSCTASGRNKCLVTKCKQSQFCAWRTKTAPVW